MSDKKEELKTEIEKENLSVNDFDQLIGVILNYYITKEAEGEMEEGETWKKASGISEDLIPEEIEDEIEKAFKSQLKRFQ
jgi:hypothetical protein